MEIPDTQLPKHKIATFYSVVAELRAFQRKAVLGRCMYWSGNCDQPPINSHLLARSWLAKIADRTNHIIQFRLGTRSLGDQPAQIEHYRVGINEATTFPGFCERHDAEVFGCLERHEFAATREQLRALAYRSICREACAKHQMVACHLPRALNQEVLTPFASRTIAEMQRCMLLLARKQALEAILQGDNISMPSYVVRFSKRPSVLMSATIYPLVTFTGRSLEFRQEWTTVSIVPDVSGGWGVFSWNHSAPKNSSLLVKSFAKVAKPLQTTALLNLVFEASENFAIAPAWWESLAAKKQRELLKRFGRSFTMGDDRPPAATLIPREPLADWGPISAGFI